MMGLLESIVRSQVSGTDLEANVGIIFSSQTKNVALDKFLTKRTE